MNSLYGDQGTTRSKDRLLHIEDDPERHSTLSHNGSEDTSKKEFVGELNKLQDIQESNVHEEYNHLKKIIDYDKEEEAYLISEDGLDIKASNDYGTYVLCNNNFEEDFGQKIYQYVNFFDFMNSKKGGCRMIKSIPFTITFLAKRSTSVDSYFIPKLVPEKNVKVKEVGLTFKWKDTAALGHIDTKLTGKTRSSNNFITENSFVMKYQDAKLLSQPNGKELINNNIKEYKKKKEAYESVIVKVLLGKYESTLTNENSTTSIEFVEPFKNLKKDSAKYTQLSQEYARSEIFDGSARQAILAYKLRLESHRLLLHFAKDRKMKMEEREKDIECEEMDDDRESFLIKSNRSSQKQKKYFTNIWKIKFSELTNIWDLGESTGVTFTLQPTYLIIKRFLCFRAECKRKGTEFIKLEQSKADLIQNIGGMFTNLIENSSNYEPRMMFKENDLARILLDIMVGCMLLYVLITIPIRFFLGAETSTFQILAKFVDMALYIDLVCNFRNSYKSKSNDRVKKIDLIVIRYLKTLFLFDLFSSVPWCLFATGSSTIYKTLNIVTEISKITRVSQVLPMFNRLDRLTGVNYIRMLKLVVICFLIAHWMACLLYLFSDTSIIWNLFSSICFSTHNEFHFTKRNLNTSCRYIITFYDSSYIIAGQYTTNMQNIYSLKSAGEYIIFILEFVFGTVLSAYIFGNITSILQNLNQGEKIFTAKSDLLREHMRFYRIDTDVQNDIVTYYEYIWQRHKDMIYGKTHFNLLSKSLRGRFEVLNLLGHEFYMIKFHQLDNPILVEQILINLKKIILFPFEILFEELSVTKGIYILLNGEIIFSTTTLGNTADKRLSVKYSNVISQLDEAKKKRELPKFNEKDNVTFPMIPAFLKTGRNWQRCAVNDFADLLFLPLVYFDEIIRGFPVEMHSMKHAMMKFVEETKLFENVKLFHLLSQHSARSIGKFYQPMYDKFTIWIPIPIPISQRKISKNYVQSFTKKIKNQWREILISGDMSIGLHSDHILEDFEPKSESVYGGETAHGSHMAEVSGKMDELEKLKQLSKKINDLLSEEK